MNYVELTVEVKPRQPFSEIIIGALADIGFESFVETETGFTGYIPEGDYVPGMEQENWAWQLDGCKLTSSVRTIPRQNWNQVWEDSFTPITVGDQVYIYAPFHERRPEMEYCIQIEPKMSFGTGHHPTTHLMVKQLLVEEVAGKKVLDMGCGTGVLAILAIMRGASEAVAIDVDDWSIENTRENCKRNDVNVTVRLGGAEAIEGNEFDLILANINLNILLEDIAAYADALRNDGRIIFSGFYVEDIAILKAHAAQHHLQQMESETIRENWASVVFTKLPNDN